LLQPGQLNLARSTENGLLEVKLQAGAAIGAPFGGRPLPGASACAKAEELLKNVAQISEVGIHARTGTCARCAPDSSVTKAIVHGASLGVAQNLVRLVDLLKLGVRLRITGVNIRMVRLG
jgi:hypothetical protein